MFLEARAASTYDELADLGHIPGHDSAHILGFLDPIENARERPEGEDARGIEIRRHPRAMLRDDPDLWDTVDRFCCGVNKDITHAEYESMSNFQLEAWLILRAASHREEMREIKRTNEDRNHGS